MIQTDNCVFVQYQAYKPGPPYRAKGSFEEYTQLQERGALESELAYPWRKVVDHQKKEQNAKDELPEAEKRTQRTIEALQRSPFDYICDSSISHFLLPRVSKAHEEYCSAYRFPRTFWCEPKLRLSLVFLSSHFRASWTGMSLNPQDYEGNRIISSLEKIGCLVSC